MGFPFKPGDWVADTGEHIAKVKAVWSDKPGECLLDLVLYDWSGECVGRRSPSLGGPRSFEPACDGAEWRRVSEPAFPMSPQWIDEGGKRVARYHAGATLPAIDWTPRKPRGSVRLTPDDRLRRALEQIAAGHNDARQLAKDALGRAHRGGQQ